MRSGRGVAPSRGAARAKRRTKATRAVKRLFGTGLLWRSRQPGDLLAVDERALLGEALRARIEDVLELQARALAAGTGGGKYSDWERGPDGPARLATAVVARWLCTGETSTQDEHVRFADPGRVAADRRWPMAEITKRYLRWRDAVWQVLDEEADHLKVSDSVRSEAFTMVRASCDGAIVRVAKRLDADLGEIQERVSYLALHDSLTGLWNRSTFLERLSKALSRRERSGRPFAVCFLDLDDFKLVNDRLGHAAGDALLVSVAERLQSAMRPGDECARFGGDEFIVACEDVNLDDAERLADRLETALVESVIIDGRELFVTASVGIVVVRSDGLSPERVVHEADAAMYVAKRLGRNHVRLAEPEGGPYGRSRK